MYSLGVGKGVGPGVGAVHQARFWCEVKADKWDMAEDPE